jgi:hypothetical protein
MRSDQVHCDALWSTLMGRCVGPCRARLLLCVVQGMRVLGKTGRSREEMASLVDSALKLLD